MSIASKRAPRAADDDDVAETTRLDTATISAVDVARLFPEANVAYVQSLQALHRALTDAIVGSKSRGAGASLVVARRAVDLAILFALRTNVRHSRGILREVITAWAALMGQATEATVESANGIGTLGAMAQLFVAAGASEYGPYADAKDSKSIEQRGEIVKRYRRVLGWLLPIAPDVKVVEEALGGPQATKYVRAPMEQLVELLDSGGLTIASEIPAKRANALGKAIRLHNSKRPSRTH